MQGVEKGEEDLKVLLSLWRRLFTCVFPSSLTATVNFPSVRTLPLTILFLARTFLPSPPHHEAHRVVPLICGPPFLHIPEPPS